MKPIITSAANKLLYPVKTLLFATCSAILACEAPPANANLDSLYANDKCKWEFEGDYCMAPNGSIYDQNFLQCGGERVKKVGQLNGNVNYYHSGLCGYLTAPSGY